MPTSLALLQASGEQLIELFNYLTAHQDLPDTEVRLFRGPKNSEN